MSQIGFLPVLRAVPIINLFASLILGIAIAFLDLAFELVAPPVNGIEVVIGEFAPLLLDPAFDLLPVSFNSVPIPSLLRV
jgi:hypothetical protein